VNLSHATELAPLLAEVDRRRGKVTFIAIVTGGWKAVVSDVGLPPHHGTGPTGAAALREVLSFAGRTDK
jgi:hypothetical protein